MSNVTEKTIISNEQLYKQYIEAQNKVKHRQEQIVLDRKMTAEMESLKKKSSKTAAATAAAALKKNEQSKNKRSFAATISLVSNMRKYENVCMDVNGEKKVQRILQPLSDATKYRDQWTKLPSDSLNDEQRTRMGIMSGKSQKSRMKQAARNFCTTNNPIEEIQRGSLVYIIIMILETFYPFNPALIELGALEISNAFVLIHNIILKSYSTPYAVLFSRQKGNSVNPPHPRQRKRSLANTNFSSTRIVPQFSLSSTIGCLTSWKRVRPSKVPHLLRSTIWRSVSKF